MAHVSAHAPASHSILSALGGLFASIGAAMMRVAESQPKVRQVSALQALSDEELAKRGLKRSEIARYVFSDSYWV